MDSAVFNNISQLENGTPSDKVIVLKSVFKQGKTTVMPVPNEMGWYLGIPRLSEDEKRKLAHWAEPDAKCVLRENKTFDLNDDAQRVTWEWVKHSPCICETKDAVQHTPGAEYYIHLENEEAKKNVSRYELKNKASDYVLNDSPTNYQMRIELLGIEMSGDSPWILKEFLLEQADTNPEKIIAIYCSKDISIKLLLLKALKKNIIRIGEGGLYMYGSNVLGTSEASAVVWMSESDNAEIVKVLQREIDPEYYKKEEKPKAKEGTNLTGSVPRS